MVAQHHKLDRDLSSHNVQAAQTGRMKYLRVLNEQVAQFGVHYQTDRFVIYLGVQLSSPGLACGAVDDGRRGAEQTP